MAWTTRTCTSPTRASFGASGQEAFVRARVIAETNEAQPLSGLVYATFESHKELSVWLRSEADKRGYGQKPAVYSSLRWSTTPLCEPALMERQMRKTTGPSAGHSSDRAALMRTDALAAASSVRA